MPGFEMERQAHESKDAAVHFHFESHSLQKLLSRQLKEWAQPQWLIDARPRIERSSGKLSPSRNWVDLEHARMRDTMLPREADSAITTAVKRDACLAWYEANDVSPQSLWLTGVLPQYQRFRDDPMPRVDVVMLPDDDEEKLLLHRVVDGDRRGEQLHVCIDESMCHPVPDTALQSNPQHSVQPWGHVDLLEELRSLAQAQGLSLQHCAERYATTSLPESQRGWWWHAALGFAKKA